MSCTYPPPGVLWTPAEAADARDAARRPGYTPTPAALAREAERLRSMARHAADCPPTFSREGWARHCQRLARDLDRRAGV